MNLAPALHTCTVPISPKPAALSHHKIVALRGEIDIATTPALRERLNDALSTAVELRRRLIIDLSGVSFCDASGLAVLIGTQRRARLLATPMCLAAPRPEVMKILRITGLDRSLTVYPTLTAAIQDHPATTAKASGGFQRVARTHGASSGR